MPKGSSAAGLLGLDWSWGTQQQQQLGEEEEEEGGAEGGRAGGLHKVRLVSSAAYMPRGEPRPAQRTTPLKTPGYSSFAVTCAASNSHAHRAPYPPSWERNSLARFSCVLGFSSRGGFPTNHDTRSSQRCRLPFTVGAAQDQGPLAVRSRSSCPRSASHSPSPYTHRRQGPGPWGVSPDRQQQGLGPGRLLR